MEIQTKPLLENGGDGEKEGGVYFLPGIFFTLRTSLYFKTFFSFSFAVENMSMDDMALVMKAMKAVSGGLPEASQLPPPPKKKKPRKREGEGNGQGARGKLPRVEEEQKPVVPTVSPIAAIQRPEGRDVTVGEMGMASEGGAAAITIIEDDEQPLVDAANALVAAEAVEHLDAGVERAALPTANSDGPKDPLTDGPNVQEGVVMGAPENLARSKRAPEAKGDSPAPLRVLTLEKALQATEQSVPPLVPDMMMRLKISKDDRLLDYQMLARSADIALTRMLGIREAISKAGIYAAEQDKAVAYLGAKVKKLTPDAAKVPKLQAEKKQLTVEVARQTKARLDAEGKLTALQEKYDNLKKANDRAESKVNELGDQVTGLEIAKNAAEMVKVELEQKLKNAEELQARYESALGSGALMAFNNAVNQIRLLNPSVDVRFVSSQHTVVDGAIVKLQEGGEREIVYEASSEDEVSMGGGNSSLS